MTEGKKVLLNRPENLTAKVVDDGHRVGVGVRSPTSFLPDFGGEKKKVESFLLKQIFFGGKNSFGTILRKSRRTIFSVLSCILVNLTCGLYYKCVTIVIDAPSVVSK
jgi:hypothetical protein